MSRKKIVAGNWKMNKNSHQTLSLIKDLLCQPNSSNCKVMIAPSFINLKHSVELLESNEIEVISQDMHSEDRGAYTGEVSAEMLKSIGVKTTILGHSERRKYFNECSAVLKEKVDQALSNDFNIIFCFGEEINDRKTNIHFDIIKKQISESLFHIDSNYWKKIILAYEPVWAIGTGETASSEQVQEMHAFIRSTISKKYTCQLSDSISILYGGSVKPSNAQEIFSMNDVDGGLIGGASLNAEDFYTIVNSF